jgi:hypothetical protein
MVEEPPARAAPRLAAGASPGFSVGLLDSRLIGVAHLYSRQMQRKAGCNG